MISFELWRARIGNWGSKKLRSPVRTPIRSQIPSVVQSYIFYDFSALVLLIIGGVELNSGPADIGKKIVIVVWLRAYLIISNLLCIWALLLNLWLPRVFHK